MTKVQPILITDIIVTALSHDAYIVASSQGSPLETWFCDESLILRQGTIHTLNSDILPTNGHRPSKLRRLYRYRLDMTEPVLQGYARKGITRFYLTLVDTSKEDSEDEINLEFEESGSDPDGIEIDESFLASSLLHPRQNLSSSPQETSAGILRYMGRESEETTTSPVDCRFRPELLQYPTSTSQDDCTLYVRTFDLSSVGILNGDWVGLFIRREVTGNSFELTGYCPFK